MSRVASSVTLTKFDRQKLELIASRPKSSQRDSLRARIVLNCAEGLQNKEVAALLGVSVQTVGKWRERFAKNGLKGLVDAPRSGAPRTISDEKVEAVLTKTLEGPPANRTHWSRRRMAKEMRLGQDSVGRIWRTFGVKPHVVNGFKLSKDPMFTSLADNAIRPTFCASCILRLFAANFLGIRLRATQVRQGSGGICVS